MQTMTILYIEDDIEDQELFKDALTEVHSDAVLLFAQNGRQGIDMLEEMASLPNIIFVDLNMPGELTGKEVIGLVRKDKRLADIPIITYTTSSRKSDREEALGRGATDYVVKPNTYKDVCVVLKEMVSRYGN
jgi:CheY-like chemotaxis protein